MSLLLLVTNTSKRQLLRHLHSSDLESSRFVTRIFRPPNHHFCHHHHVLGRSRKPFVSVILSESLVDLPNTSCMVTAAESSNPTPSPTLPHWKTMDTLDDSI